MTLSGNIVSATAGLHGFDADAVVSAGKALLFKQSGFAFCIRYLTRELGQAESDLSTSEADGILDAAVGRRGEQAKPKEAARDAWIARQKAAVVRTLAVLEADPPHRHLDIGSISVACALGYLDFRFAHEPWREAHPALSAWFASISEEPALARTVPADRG